MALGTAAGIIDELKSRLFLVEDAGGARRLIRKKELFEGWVTAYRPIDLIDSYLQTQTRIHGWRARR